MPARAAEIGFRNLGFSYFAIKLKTSQVQMLVFKGFSENLKNYVTAENCCISVY